jgi:hypothetical protein
LTDDAGDFVYLNTFWPATTDLIMLSIDAELDAANVKVTVSATNPTSQKLFSSKLEWAHGMTLANWDAGEAGGHVRIQSYAVLAPNATTIRATDLTVGQIPQWFPIVPRECPHDQARRRQNGKSNGTRRVSRRRRPRET